MNALPRCSLSYAKIAKKHNTNNFFGVFFLFKLEPTLKSKACFKCLYFTKIISDLCRCLEYFFVSFLFYHDRVAHARTMCGVVYSHAHHRVGTAPLACQRGLMVIVPRPRYACTPTEVRMYPDRGTHVSRPRYAHFTTEMSIHHDQDEHTRRPKCGDQAAPTTYPRSPCR